ncbi:unnamed protein product, partial [Cyprideis torosa]
GRRKGLAGTESELEADGEGRRKGLAGTESELEADGESRRKGLAGRESELEADGEGRRKGLAGTESELESDGEGRRKGLAGRESDVAADKQDVTDATREQNAVQRQSAEGTWKSERGTEGKSEEEVADPNEKGSGSLEEQRDPLEKAGGVGKEDDWKVVEREEKVEDVGEKSKNFDRNGSGEPGREVNSSEVFEATDHMDGLSCSDCHWVTYCGSLCQMSAWQKHHQYECKALQRLDPMENSIILLNPARMMVRILTLIHLGDGLKVQKRVSLVEGARVRTYRDLASHADELRKDHLLMTGMFPKMKLLLEKLLRGLNLRLTEDLLIEAYGKYVINCLPLDDESYGRIIGEALLLAVSSVDHSCCPSAKFHNIGGLTYIRTVVDIPDFSWDKVRINYLGAVTNALSTEDRQERLRIGFHFICACSFCSSSKFDMEKDSMRCRTCDEGMVPVNMLKPKNVRCLQCGANVTDQQAVVEFLTVKDQTKLWLRQMESQKQIRVETGCPYDNFMSMGASLTPKEREELFNHLRRQSDARFHPYDRDRFVSLSLAAYSIKPELFIPGTDFAREILQVYREKLRSLERYYPWELILTDVAINTAFLNVVCGEVEEASRLLNDALSWGLKMFGDQHPVFQKRILARVERLRNKLQSTTPQSFQWYHLLETPETSRNILKP